MSKSAAPVKVVYKTHPLILTLSCVLSLVAIFVVLHQQSEFDNYLVSERIAILQHIGMNTACLPSVTPMPSKNK